MADLTPAKFVAKWKPVDLPERAASQEFFLDLCRLLGQPTPAEHDATGAEYAFEKGVAVEGGASKGAKGNRGFADAWWRGKFAWEFKRRDKYKSLDEAYKQLLKYREALDNPPLLIVCDIQNIEIHTNFTGTAKQVHRISLDEIAEPAALDLLRRTFASPKSLKPKQTPEQVTKIVAEKIGELAHRLRDRGHDPHDAAHFLMKCMFCLFAEDVDLLPKDRFKGLAEAGLDALRKGTADEAQVQGWFTELFQAMRTGGHFWGAPVAWFNGGLFDEAPALPLTADDLATLTLAAKQDWSAVEPAIFGTLFERSLDPAKRSQIGAHYTSREDILLIVEPVVMAPLRREWDETRTKIEEQIERRRAVTTTSTKKKADDAIAALLDGFIERLSSVRILDPACGSGNFLYVAIQQLLGLEKEVITFAARPEIGQSPLPQVRPTQLYGVEISPYAAELAQVVIWIGYLQWMRDNGFRAPSDPILSPLTTIENKDAILDLTDPAKPRIPEWPEADFIIGNPPFLGSRKARMELGDRYVDAYQQVYRDALPEGADLCCYWFELARRAMRNDASCRIGLLATQAIRTGSSREVLRRIAEDGTLFFAIADRKWILDGAAVRISMAGFSRSTTEKPILDGKSVAHINADLSGDIDLTAAHRLPENASCAFQGTINSGPFDIDWKKTRSLLSSPTVTEHSNVEVLHPWINARDLTDRKS
ncbi:MAG: DNA methyltransferase, partial [Phycisphaerales bacterium JB038]